MSDVLVYNAIAEHNKMMAERLREEADEILQERLAEAPWSVTDLWHCIPLIATNNANAVLCVHTSQDASFSTGWNCGACCEWTVPDGVTCAQFQIWGPGARSAGSSCCVYSPGGGSGAYATIALPVTPGDSYTLCAGCACCCGGCWTSGVISPVIPSYVTGNGLHNVCAEGGEGNQFCFLRNNGQAGSCQVPDIGRCYPNQNMCFCQCAAICSVSAILCDAYFCKAVSYQNTGYGQSNRPNASRLWYIPSQSTEACYESKSCSWYIYTPPIIGVDHNVCSGSCVTLGFPESGLPWRQCYGGRDFRAAANVLTANIAGFGGMPGYSCTSSCMCGDAGRGGMIRVTWC